MGCPPPTLPAAAGRPVVTALPASPLATLCVPMEHLTPEALVQVADYFQALAEPTRLRILNLLRHEPRSVGELAAETGHSVANVSRHLTLLAQRGLLARETRGTSVYYRIADPAIYELCNLVCGNLGRRIESTEAQRAAFAPPARRRARPTAR
jgi:DNA-binding transcriptional ArsR family regulator